MSEPSKTFKFKLNLFVLYYRNVLKKMLFNYLFKYEQ